MGFFLKPEEAAEAWSGRQSHRSRVTPGTEKGRAATRKKQKSNASALDPKALGCEHCSLKQRWPLLASPCMPTVSRGRGADILILTNWPTEEEDKSGKLYEENPRSMICSVIPAAFRERVLFQNLARCHPGDQEPTIHDFHACTAHLADDIARYKIKAIIGLGREVLSFFVGNRSSILQAHGLPFPIKVGGHSLWFMPTLDPVFVNDMKSQWGDGPAMPIFKSDIQGFMRGFNFDRKPYFFEFDPKAIIVPKTEAEARELVSQLEEPYAIDIETTKLKPHMKGAKILTASVSDGKLTIAWPVEHPKHPCAWGAKLLLDVAEEKEWIAHNSYFEFIWLFDLSLRMDRKRDLNTFHDTQAQARIVHKRESMGSLAVVTRAHLGVDVKLLSDLDVKRLLEYPIEQVLVYNGLDAQASALVFRRLKPVTNNPNYKRLIKVSRSLATMELAGLPTDPQEVEKQLKLWRGVAEECEKKAVSIYEVKQWMRAKGDSFNLGSNAQVADALVTYGKVDLPKTDKGKAYKTDDETLMAIAPDHPLVKLVLEYRPAVKFASTYCEPLHDLENKTNDGLVHPGYSALLVITGRLSSEDPNIQNFPKRKHRELRRMIVAPPGHILVAIDYGQLEARVMAMATRCRNLVNSILKGRDIHTDWLNNVLNIYPDYLDRLAHATGQNDPVKIRKYGRDIIKTDFVFSSFYGSAVKSIVAKTQIPHDKVTTLHSTFWQEFSGVKNWIKARRKEYADTGSSFSLTGRERHSILWNNEPINNPIQGTAADIVLESQIALSERANAEGDFYFHPRINVHDDLTFILPDKKKLLRYYIEEIVEEMTRVRFDWQIVPLAVEVKVGYNWADMTDYGVYTGEHVR